MNNNKSINLFTKFPRNLLTKLPRSSKRNPVDELFRPKRIIPLEKKEEEKKKKREMHGGKRSFQVVLVYKRGPSGWPSRVARRVSISRERRVRRSFVRSFPRLSFHPSPRIDAIRMIPSLRGVTERVRARFSKKLVGWNPVRKRERDEERE